MGNIEKNCGCSNNIVCTQPHMILQEKQDLPVFTYPFIADDPAPVQSESEIIYMAF